ncbi:MAG: hypothetical protein Q9224_004276 [Gallowayella concinna]
MPRAQKRHLDAAQPSEPSTALSESKRQKSECQQREEKITNFWDDLSYVPLCLRALQEFDRRTISPVASVQSKPITEERIDSTLLKYFAENGGPSLEDLRTYRTLEDVDVKTGISSYFTMGGDNTTGAYDLTFEQHLSDHGVYLPDEPSVAQAPKPLNQDEILSRLGRARSSERVITEDDWNEFKEDNKSCSHEPKVKQEVVRTIAGKTKLNWEPEIEFNNMNTLTEYTKKVKPDYYDGSKPSELAGSIRTKLKAYIVPSTNDARPLLPNFSFEVKGPTGDLNCLNRQALHNGALGARAVHELRSWTGVKKLDDQKAYTIAATYQPVGGQLTLFAIHPVPSKNPKHRPLSSVPGSRWKYHMTLLNGYLMTNDLDGFKKGVYAYRNAREWAEEQRKALIKAANSNAEDAPME